VGDGVRISIDSTRCEGHGRCWENAPDLVDDDEDGRGAVRGDGVVPTEFEHQARIAEGACPERAVILSH
jgi:ferredoxin